ncbi:MAG: hypothetical protein R3C49_00780 [Planctomycetaceae bacterium]
MSVSETKEAIELLSLKIGRSITVLGIWHFCNLTVLCRIRDVSNIGKPGTR